MNNIKYLSDNLSNVLGVNSTYMLPIMYTATAIIVINIFVRIITFIFNHVAHNEKFIYLFNKKTRTYSTILLLLIVFLIWEEHIQNVMVLISLISAGITLSLKEIILNYFSGLYIRLKKPFKVEDRILINDVEGDVININTTNFEILEISNKENGEQSTGIIVHIPNSTIFTNPLKNYTKAFKYIWNEIAVKVPINSDLKTTKAELYRIINTNEVVKAIPKKMENQIDNVISDYRIFYNKLEPIIYTKVQDNYIELSIRYLVHPKKARNVESDVWNKILEANNNGKIKLYIKE